MAPSPRFCKRIRLLARNALVLVLTVSLAFGGWRGPGQRAFAEEANATLEVQAAAKPFMDAPSSKPDPASLTATNWMSGIDGGRYLSEVNIPGAHDACTQHMLQAMSELKAIGQPYAECQDMQYPDMLEKGVRILDLRLNNWYLEDIALPAWAEALIAFFGPVVWVIERIIEWIIEQTDANKGDDGRNCYLVHGDNSWGRTYWASKTGDGNDYITFNNVLDTCKNFLKDHPSEIIILYLADEVTDSDQISRIRARAKGILQGLANEINPSTGESYLYMEGGTFAAYTTMPKVGDARGKIVIASNNPDDFGVGMTKDSGIGYNPGEGLTCYLENNYDVSAEDKWNYIKGFFNDHVGEGIPRNLFTHLDHMNKVYTSSNRIMSESPRSIAGEINPRVYSGSDALIQGTGTYYGWVLSDVVGSDTATPVWKSNFPDDMEYCTVTVKTGDTGGAFDSPDQTYVVLKGEQITFPGDIYADLHGDEVRFAGWHVSAKTHEQGDVYTVKYDVTISATWDKKAEISVALTWDDSDDNDGIRPSTVVMSLRRDDGKYGSVFSVDAKSEWKHRSPVYVPMGKKPTNAYRLNVVHNEVITGKNTITTYADSVRRDGADGFAVELVHTKNLYTVQGSVAWSDEGDLDGARPYSIKAFLKDGGETVATKTVSLSDCDQSDPSMWNVSFEKIPLKRANGEDISYVMGCGWYDLYNLYTMQDVAGIATDHFTVTNAHTPNMVAATCTVEWNDAGDADNYRPDSVTLRLMADGREVERHALNTADTTESTFAMTFSDQKRYHFGKPIRYTVNQNRIDHYFAWIMGSADAGFTITNTHAKDKTSMSVASHWLDANNQDGKRPTTLNVRLYADGQDTGRTVALSADNDWYTVFDNLDIHRDGGEEIVYTVEAERFEYEDDYDFESYGDYHEGYDLVYEHTPEIAQLKGSVAWDDAHNQDGVRPSSVALVARQAGATVLKFDVYPGEEPDEWAWSSNELPAYKPGGQGVKLDYSVAAASAIGYDAPAISELEDESWVASYHRDPQTVDIVGQVIWDDDDNRDGIRPDSVGVMLWRDGESYMGTRVAAAEGNWTYDFDNMPRYEGEGDERHEIRYSVTASGVEGYKWEATGFDPMYTHAPKKTDVHVMQIWNDGEDADGLRLDKVELALYANGAPTGKTLALTADSNWMGEFDSMPANDHGTAIAYSIEVAGEAVEELRARGYSVDLVEYGANDWSVIATRTPDTVTVRGTIVWDDGDNEDGLRPDSVIVRASRDGGAGAMTTATAGTDGQWTWEIGGLTKKNAGKEIAYAINEDEVEGYTTEITGGMKEGFTIVNHHGGPSYSFVAGDGGSWTHGSNATLDFTVKRSRDDSTTLSHFTGIQVDGKDVPQNAYEASAGSVVIKLKPTYLEKLADGSHSITASFDDGSVRANFAVKPASVIPGTHDAIPFTIIIIVLAAAALLAAYAAMRSRASTRR